MNAKERILIFGTGSGALKVVSTLEKAGEIVGYIDNAKEKQGKLFNKKLIYSPTEIQSLNYDKIVICSVAYKTIRKQLLEIGIPEEKITNRNYFHMKKILEKYENNEKYSDDLEIQETIQYIKKNGLNFLNCELNEDYDEYPVNVFFDKDRALYYAIYKGKKMYLSKEYSDENKAINYVRGLLREQDKQSPHCYLTDSFTVPSGAVVIDAGVAEGNFALDIIDDIKKIYLIEMDEDWIEALNYTFEDYKDKVVIIKKCLSDNDEGENITLDSVAGNEKIDFIKMDIEGYEVAALKGASHILESDNVKLDVCAYHNANDERDIKEILMKKGYSVESSKGYMVFLSPEKFQNIEEVSLVRGLVRAWK